MIDVLAREATAVLGLTLSSEQRERFARYLALLLEWNRRLNLTAVREPDEIQRRHFLDALTCVRVMEMGDGRLPGCWSLVDVGAGAGFPGLPLKIWYPQMRLTLVESVAKKARFLEVVVAELGLRDVSIVMERAERLGQDAAFRSCFDWAVARAVAELRVLVEYLLPFCRVGGRVLAQKGAGVAVEVDAAMTAIVTLGGAVPRLYPVQLPQRREPHYLVLIEKTRETPDRYPRRTGVPMKRPL